MKGANRLEQFSESQTLALTKKVRELKASGKDVLGLTLGEPDFDTPAHIREAGILAIQSGFTHYPPVSGIAELREAAAKKFREQNQIPYQAENIIVSTGAKQSLVNVIMALVNPGDEVILIAPYWVSYYQMVLMAEGIPAVLETSLEQGFRITPDRLDKAIGPKTKMVIFNSPSNPTGTMYNRDEVAALVKIIEKHSHVFLVSDEIYEHISYGTEHVSPASFSSIYDRTITVNGVSKGFAMTGWRIGYLGAPKWITELCEKYQGQFTSGASTISQWATVAALNGELYPTYAMRDQFRERRDLMFGELSDIPGFKTALPEGAFYFYPDVSDYFGKKTPDGKTISDINDFCEYLLMTGLVAVIPGDAFGTSKHIRISYAYSVEAIRKAMHRIKEALGRLK